MSRTNEDQGLNEELPPQPLAQATTSNIPANGDEIDHTPEGPEGHVATEAHNEESSDSAELSRGNVQIEYAFIVNLVSTFDLRPTIITLYLSAAADLIQELLAKPTGGPGGRALLREKSYFVFCLD